ncbi:MAG: AmmeMemoRadiSam system protein B [Candidatus Omnitrophica bacterium]|nr:AmmeMemoRadiSam system protein B [Candidatus Omnitrophota bacterium]
MQIKINKFILKSIFLAAFFIGLGKDYCILPGNAEEIKKAEFAGFFYPADSKDLNSSLDRYLKEAEVSPIEGEILGVICPHAGYIYSAAIAAYSFKILENKKIDTVIILAPTHNYYFEGVSIYPQGFFQTPLGNLEVDSELAREFKNLNFVQFKKEYFNREHSVEVELPFIRKVMGEVKIVPVIFGSVGYEEMEHLAEKLFRISSRRNIIIVVSTDLSHYHPYEAAVKIDSDTMNLIREKDSRKLWNTRSYSGGRACGMGPLITFLEYVKKKRARIEILKYANSGDTAGDRSRVVGYLSAAACVGREFQSLDNERQIRDKGREMREKAEDRGKEYKKVDKEEAGRMEDYDLIREEKISLLNIARKTLEIYLKSGGIPEFNVNSKELKEERGAFVTLKKGGALRGCIGRIVSDTPLYKVISKLAVDSAVNDPRFKPLSFEELKEVEIEISVLSPFEKINKLEEIEVGKHGLIIQKGFSSGLLLPQVPVEYNWDRTTFLEHLCSKAGLPQTAYKDEDAVIHKFIALVFSEDEFKDSETAD